MLLLLLEVMMNVLIKKVVHGGARRVVKDVLGHHLRSCLRFRMGHYFGGVLMSLSQRVRFLIFELYWGSFLSEHLDLVIHCLGDGGG
jgi:hypothetical protein